MRKLLHREDYVNAAEGLSRAADAKNILDFMLHLLRDHRLPNRDPTLNIDQRARRFMMKVISKIPVIPPSLIVTGVTMTASLVGGGFGSVFKGEFQGSAVVLKALHRSDTSIVSPLFAVAMAMLFIVFQQAFCREVLMWHSLTHKCVLPLLGIYEYEWRSQHSRAFLVSPYMENGTLAQWRKNSNPPITEIEKRVWLLFILLSMGAHVMEDTASGPRP